MTATRIKGIEVAKSSVRKFWSRVRVAGKNECWLWQAGFNGKKRGHNYGLIHLPDIGKVLAHRVALALTTGKWSDTLHTLHECDNPPCCNPNHLFLGTQADNVQDCTDKKRRGCVSGVNHPGAKLNDDKVRKMKKLVRLREKYMKYTKAYFANKHGVDPALIHRIIKGTSWRHIP